jgi:hypothetical protein
VAAERSLVVGLAISGLTQFSSGSGARWASLIETTAASE